MIDRILAYIFKAKSILLNIMSTAKSIYELADLCSEDRDISIMTEAPSFTEQALTDDPSLQNLTTDEIIEMLRPVVTQFRSDSEAGVYEYSRNFPDGVCGEAREHLVPLIERLGFYVVCRVFETPTPGFHRVATVGDLIIDPTVDADEGDVDDKVYIGPQNERYKDITTPEQFTRIARSYWGAERIFYFNQGGFVIERDDRFTLIPISLDKYL
jgi:hypothetical protein